MIKTKSIRESPSSDDGVRVLVLGFEGKFEYGIFRDLILPTLAYDEEAVLLRPSATRLCRLAAGRDSWTSFVEMYRRAICYSDAAYAEMRRYAERSKTETVTFLDMCDSPERSVRKVVAGMCSALVPRVETLIA